MFARQGYKALTFYPIDVAVARPLGTELSSHLSDRHEPPYCRIAIAVPAHRVRRAGASHGEFLQPGGAALFPELHSKHHSRNPVGAPHAWTERHLLRHLSNGARGAAGNCFLDRGLDHRRQQVR